MVFFSKKSTEKKGCKSMSVSVSVIMAMKKTCNVLESKVFSFSESSFMAMK